MQEYFDIVDENNIPTREKKLRSESHAKGFWHRTVHIYLFKKVDDKFYFIVHLRAKNKDLHPNCWDTRFGGHIKAGENVEDTVKSELMEEVGLKLEKSNLIQGEIYKRDKYPNREFTYSFYYKFDEDISTLKFNDGEVQEIKWMESSDMMKSMTDNPQIWAGSKEGVIKILDVLKNKLNN
ncbi:MAG TPA: NUDIX domain-containing protein [Candidatus Paceibacterota bacterium]|nr:NUDIX domain-containing protein [Candidatus Paceibacterota bacterium]